MKEMKDNRKPVEVQDNLKNAHPLIQEMWKDSNKDPESTMDPNYEGPGVSFED